MSLSSKPYIEKIIEFCDRMLSYLEEYDYDYDKFKSSHMLQDACCLCIIQIGETVAHMSQKDLVPDVPSIPWQVIKDTRNFYVHSYGNIDWDAVWETMQIDIPALREACVELLKGD